jgi:hypothetical protein
MNPLLFTLQSQRSLSCYNVNNFGINLEIYFIYSFQKSVIIIIIIIMRVCTGNFPAFKVYRNIQGDGMTPKFFFVISYYRRYVN